MQTSNAKAKFRRSLGVKLNVANITLSIMVCLMVTVSYYNVLANRIEDQARAEIADVLSTLNISLEAKAEVADLQRVVGALAAKSTIRRMSILSGDTVIADSNGQFIGRSRDFAFDNEVSQLLVQPVKQNQEFLLDQDQGVMHQAHQLFWVSPEEQRLRPYQVYIAYNTDLMERQAKSDLIEFIIIQAIGFILILLVNPLIQREVVLKPIRSIRTQITKNPRATIDFRSNDEFGLMIDSYNNAIRQRQIGEKELLQSRHYIDKVTNVIPVQLAYVDRDLKLRFVNRRLLQWLGKSEAQVLGKDLASVMPQELETIIRPHISRALKGRIQVFESQLEEADTGQVFLQSTYVPDLDEHQDVNGFFMCVEDMTHIKANEHKIELYAQEMEFKNWALTEATEKAQEATRTKADFLACMSHEIRTPMNGVLGILSLLEQTELSRQQRQYVSVASSSADALLTLLNDILDFSKVESGKFVIDKTEFDFLQLLDDVIQPLAMRSEEKGLQLILDIKAVDSRWINGDPTRIRQILSNLIGNAIKFTEQGWVKVSVNVTEYDGRLRLRAEVEDTGIGIDEENQGMLFQPFVQADSSTTRHFGGTGLGLSIAKRLCQLMCGDIRVSSQPGKGSVFAFHIEVEQAPQQSDELWPPCLAEQEIMMVREQAFDDDQVRVLLNSWGADTQVRDLGIFNDIENPPSSLICSVPLHPTDIDALLEQLVGVANLGSNVMAIMSHKQVLEASERFGNKIHLSTRPAQLHVIEACLKGKLAGDPASEGAIVNFENKYKILLVEDSKVNQIVIKGMLKKLGLQQVLIAANGEKALAVLESTDFDLVLMDCQMPVMDGYHATQAIRMGDAGEGKRDLPVIALTANAMQGDREKCLAAGMDDYISKPLSIPILGITLSKYLGVNGSTANATPAVAYEGKTMDQPCMFNLDSALKTFMGDRELLNETLAAFVDEMTSLAVQLEVEVEAQNADVIVAISHTIKGASANLSMGPLATKAKELESIAKKGQSNDVANRYRELSLLFEATVQQVNEILNIKPQDNSELVSGDTAG